MIAYVGAIWCILRRTQSPYNNHCLILIQNDRIRLQHIQQDNEYIQGGLNLSSISKKKMDTISVIIYGVFLGQGFIFPELSLFYTYPGGGVQHPLLQ